MNGWGHETHQPLIYNFFIHLSLFTMEDLRTLEDNYFPNISLPNFDRDALQASFDASYRSPGMYQDQGDDVVPICGSVSCVFLLY